MRIYETLCIFCQNQPERKNVIEHLQCAIVDNVRTIQTATSPRWSSQSPSIRGEEIFHKFKVLVSRNARTERKVSFYADVGNFTVLGLLFFTIFFIVFSFFFITQILNTYH